MPKAISVLLVPLLFTGFLHAQVPAVQSARSLQLDIKPVSPESIASGDYSPPKSFIENRARTLGTSVASGSGNQFFAATDVDLAGKTSKQALQRLSPPAISAQDHVRKLFILIDLQNPWKFLSTSGQPANVGTAIVNSGVHHLEVQTSIFANSGLTVVSK